MPNKVNNDSEILLSIAVITYNHENYIRQALNSILMQNVNFKYEIIIGEDCSPDNTRTVLLEYQKKYPNRIKLILRDKNVGATKNLYDVFMNCKGKYIATLEGDDFWTNSNKLQLQVDFLEEHKEYVGVSHDFEYVNKNGEHLSMSNQNRSDSALEFTMNNFTKWEWPIQTATLLFHNFFLTNKDEDFSIIYTAHNLMADRTLAMLILKKSNILIIREAMSAYRYVIEKDGTNYTSQFEMPDNRKDIVEITLHYINMLEKYLKSCSNYNFDYIKKQFVSEMIIKTIKIHTSNSVRDLTEILGMVSIKVKLLSFFDVLKVTAALPSKKIKLYVANLKEL
ncbi:MAG TPA: glycosyltransferase [Clostridium sp.]|uniref:glycosyltransferase n=1 Tax=Clostridium sp. TaxID=1506 RepID=UPI002F936C1C